MDNNDELKKKADEFMEILRKKREEAEKLEQEKKAKQIIGIGESISAKHLEKTKEDVKFQIVQLESFKRSQELLNSKPIPKEKSKKENRNWGFLIAIIAVGAILTIAILVNAFTESAKANSPWIVGGTIIYMIIALLAWIQGPKRRY
jgi:K+-sensing histidine kinase KdpD